MNTLVLLSSAVVLAVAIGVVCFLFKTRWGKRNEFDATRDLFI